MIMIHEFICDISWPMNSYMNSCIWRISWNHTWSHVYQDSRWSTQPEYHVGCLFQVTKVTFLAVCGADLGSKLTTNSLRQIKLLDLSQYIFLFTMHRSSSSNLHCKLKLTKILSDLSLTSQVFSSLLTWNNKHSAVGSYGIGKEGQKSSGLFWACLLAVTC